MKPTSTMTRLEMPPAKGFSLAFLVSKETLQTLRQLDGELVRITAQAEPYSPHKLHADIVAARAAHDAQPTQENFDALHHALLHAEEDPRVGRDLANRYYTLRYAAAKQAYVVFGTQAFPILCELLTDAIEACGQEIKKQSEREDGWCAEFEAMKAWAAYYGGSFRPQSDACVMLEQRRKGLQNVLQSIRMNSSGAGPAEMPPEIPPILANLGVTLYAGEYSDPRKAI